MPYDIRKQDNYGRKNTNIILQSLNELNTLYFLQTEMPTQQEKNKFNRQCTGYLIVIQLIRKYALLNSE